MKLTQQPKVALVYDKVNTQYGGAEVVLTALHELFPDAELFTSVYNPKTALWAQSFTVITSFLQKIPWMASHHQLLLPLMPLAFESFNFDNYDIIISITSADAKGIRTKPHQLHLCYLLTPPRYLYSHQQQYLQASRFLQLPIIKYVVNKLLHYLKAFDQNAALSPDVIIPISKLIKKRVKTYYGIECEQPLYPPVSLQLKSKEIDAIPTFPYDYFLSVSRLVEYKRVDISIKACIAVKKMLVIVGEGSAKKNLLSIAPQQTLQREADEPLIDFFTRAQVLEKSILFVGKATTQEVHQLLKSTQALLMPGEEDFGITALEAGYFGKPVILFYKSGVCELLENNRHALFLKHESVSEMAEALGKIETMSFDSNAIQTHIAKYSIESFKKQFKMKLTQVLKGQYVVS